MSGVSVQDGNFVIGKWPAGIAATLVTALIIWLAGSLLYARDRIPLIERDIAALRADMITGMTARDARASAATARRDAEVTSIKADVRALDEEQGKAKTQLIDRLARMEENLKTLSADVGAIKAQISTASLRR